MKKRILILEDNEISRKALVKIVKSCGDVIVHDFSNRNEAYTCAMDYEIDLFLLDIILEPKEKNDHSGIVFARHIRENTRYFSANIVFITTLSGLEGKLLREIHCYDYIEKPISAERVRSMVTKLLYQMNYKKPEREMTCFRIDGISYPVYVDEIIYVRYKSRMLTVNLAKEEFNVPYLPLKKFLERVRDNTFLEPTKGVAVNLQYIKSVDFPNRMIQLKKREDSIEIGARMKSVFQQEYNRYCEVRK